MLYYCYLLSDNSQVNVKRFVASCRNVRMTPAASDDLRMLLPRMESRAEVERHALKLQCWTRTDDYALDLPVVAIPDTEFFTATLADCFGLKGDLRFIIWEHVLYPPDGQIWILGFCRGNETSWDSILTIVHQRKAIIEESETLTSTWFFD